MRRTFAVLAGLMLVAVAFPGAQAHDAGASGGCNDDDDPSAYPAGQNVFENEEADVAVNTSGGADAPDALDTAHALGNLAEGFAAGNPPSDNCDGPQSWLAVYAAGEFVVCYDGAPQTDTNPNNGYNFYGECKHHDGAGNSNGDLLADNDGENKTHLSGDSSDCFSPNVCLNSGDV